MKVLLLDNYDSFTYNLFHYLEGFDVDVTVIRNDEIDLVEVSQFDKIILSPGPGLPSEAGKMNELIERYHTSKPILGVCLGMQAIGEFFGASLYNQIAVKHGVQEMCNHINSSILFKNIPISFEVGLYHSWAVDIKQSSLLIPTGWSENNVLMALEHASFPIFGVQFHPESILTPYGKTMIYNFLFNISE